MITTEQRIINKKEVLQITGFSKSTLYNRIIDGVFPPAVNLGGRRVGFVLSECETALQGFIAGLSASEMKNLVEGLIQKRKTNLEGFYD